MEDPSTMLMEPGSLFMDILPDKVPSLVFGASTPTEATCSVWTKRGTMDFCSLSGNLEVQASGTAYTSTPYGMLEMYRWTNGISIPIILI